jgi:hypothetical protein
MISPFSTFECLNQSLRNLVYTAPGPISTACFINPSHQSVSIRLPPIAPRQRIGKNVTVATNTHAIAEKHCWARRSLCGPCRIKGLVFTYFIIKLICHYFSHGYLTET